MEKVQIVWFRRDLRLEDNLILNQEFNYPLLPIFIFDTNILKKLSVIDARITFIFDQVIKLKQDLKKIQLDLAIFYGKPSEVLNYLSNMYEIKEIICSSDNDPYSIQRDSEISRKFNLKIVFDNFLIEPGKVQSKQGHIFTIFTHFKNAVAPIVNEFSEYNSFEHKRVKLAEYESYDKIIQLNGTLAHQAPLVIDSIGFKRQKLSFDGVLKTPYELLEEFSKSVAKYDEIRNFPSVRGTSLLSTHLRFGTISVRLLAKWALKHNAIGFVSELIWREFFNYLLFHHPETIKENLQKNVKVEWKNNPEHIQRWENAQTGIPLVDAGIRELIETGYMHNRVRMVVASFLTKNLLIDWRYGEEFFAKYLFDYEISSNVGNWQWVAGVGTDPRSATRIFNPFIQSQKFDPNCDYIYKWVSELRNIPAEKIHNPEFILNSKVQGYVKPLIKDLKTSTLAFKIAYKRTKT